MKKSATGDLNTACEPLVSVRRPLRLVAAPLSLSALKVGLVGGRGAKTRTVHRLVSAVGLAALLCACGDGEGGRATGPTDPAAPPRLDIVGEWAYEHTLRGGLGPVPVECKAYGMLEFKVVQPSSRLGGSISRSGSCGFNAGSPTAALSNVQVFGSTIRFETSSARGSVGTLCQFSGTLEGSPPSSGTGEVQCKVEEPPDRTWVEFIGTWLATRGDGFPPEVSGVVVQPAPDGTYATGDTIQLDVGAIDYHGQLAWVGYRLGPPVNSQDSVAASGRGLLHAFGIVVQTGWEGQPTLGVFGRDRAGNLGETLVSRVSIRGNG